MRVVRAWQRFFADPNKLPGHGVIVGHPDTGYRRHPEISANLLVNKGRDFVDGDSNAEDQLEGGALLLRFPGHGTATASVIASPQGAQSRYQSDPSGKAVNGIAPGAKIMPLRVSRSVVLWEGSTVKLANAIEYASDQGAHVISISMGTGFPSERLEKAVQYAHKRGVIVLAAAGNYVPFVVWPAAFAEVIAVAASNAVGKTWRYSSRGSAVDVTAPGESVWVARVEKKHGNVRYSVERGSGTSYAVAAVAGVAAMWLSRHGRARLEARYGVEKIPFVFNEILRTTCEPIESDSSGRFGAGLVNAERVLAAPLPDAADHPVPSLAFGLSGSSPTIRGGLETFAHLFESATAGGRRVAASSSLRYSEKLQSALSLFLNTTKAELPSRLKEVGQELAFHLATDADLYERFEAALSSRPSTRRALGPRAARAPARNAGTGRRALLAKGISKALRARIEGP